MEIESPKEGSFRRRKKVLLSIEEKARLFDREIERKNETARAHYQRYKERINANTKKYTQDVKSRLFSILTPKEAQTACCAVCGITDTRFFQIHHINGDGKEDIIKYGESWKNHYSKHPEEARMKLEILCYGCHGDKRAETIAMRKNIIKEAELKRQNEILDSYGEQHPLQSAYVKEYNAVKSPSE